MRRGNSLLVSLSAGTSELKYTSSFFTTISSPSIWTRYGKLAWTSQESLLSCILSSMHSWLVQFVVVPKVPPSKLSEIGLVDWAKHFHGWISKSPQFTSLILLTWLKSVRDLFENGIHSFGHGDRNLGFESHMTSWFIQNGKKIQYILVSLALKLREYD